MKHIIVQRVNELKCPICHASENCKIHLVEHWEPPERKSYLKKVLAEMECSPEIAERLLTQYPTPESCFPGSILLSWQNTFVTPPTEHQALFHPEGCQLFQRYREFIILQIQAPNRFRHLLHVLKPASQDVPDSQEPDQAPEKESLESAPTQTPVSKQLSFETSANIPQNKTHSKPTPPPQLSKIQELLKEKPSSYLPSDALLAESPPPSSATSQTASPQTPPTTSHVGMDDIDQIADELAQYLL